jgi:hypothetical protein
MAATYEIAMAEIRQFYLQVLSEPSGFEKLSFDDASIVPTQQFTRYPDLIKAVIKAVIKVTPQSHPDMGPLQRAFIKYSYIGRTSNEKKKIAESQKEPRAIKLMTNMRNQTSTVRLDGEAR